MTIDFETARQQVESNPLSHSDEARTVVVAAVGENEYAKMLHASAANVHVGIQPAPGGTIKRFTIGTSMYGRTYVESEPTTTSYPPPSTDRGPLRAATGERFITNYSGPTLRNDVPAATAAPQSQPNAGDAERKFATDPLTLTRDEISSLQAKWGKAEYTRRANAYMQSAGNRKVTVR